MTSQQFSTPCTCRGGNPNCFRCGGWGYIDGIGKGRASPGLASTGKLGAIRSGRRKAFKVCPVCGQSVMKLEKHLKKVHSDEPNLGADPQPVPATPLIGAKKLSSTKALKLSSLHTEPPITGEIKLAKRNQGQQVTRAKKPRRPLHLPALEICPLCTSRVATRHLKRHVRTKHITKWNMLDTEDKIRLDKWLRENYGISFDLKLTDISGPYTQGSKR